MTPRPATVEFPWRALVGALAVLAGVVACSGIITGPDAPDLRPRSMRVAPASVTVALGDTARIVASLYDATGAPTAPEQGVPLGYVSSDTTIARVDATGLVTGVGGGTASVRGVYGALTLGVPVQVTVRPRVVVISGDAQTAEQGDTLPLPIVVRALDAAGQPLPGVTVDFVITGGNGIAFPSSAQTDANGRAETRWLLGTALGTQQLRAQRTASDSAVFTATATPGTRVVRVGVTATRTTLSGLGDTTQLAARAYNVVDSLLPAAAFTWSSSDTTVLVVSPAGLVTARTIGAAWVRAASGSHADSVQLTVAPVVSSGVLHWSGAVSTDWTLPANWAEGIAPTATDSVVIPASGVTRMPVITVDDTIRALVSLNAGQLSMTGNTLTVAQALVLRTDVVAADCQGGGFELTVPSGATPTPLAGRVACAVYVTTGARVLVDSLVVEGSTVSLLFGATLELAGHPLRVPDGRLFVLGQSRLEMRLATDRVHAQSVELAANGEGSMFAAGELHLRDLLWVGAGSGDFTATGTHRVVVEAPLAGARATLATAPGVRFRHVTLQVPTTVDGLLTMTGDLTLAAGATMQGSATPSFGTGPRLRVEGNYTAGAGASSTLPAVELGGALVAPTFGADTLVLIGSGQRLPLDGTVAGLRSVRVAAGAVATIGTTVNTRRLLLGDLIVEGDLGMAEAFVAAIEVNGAMRVTGNGILRLGGTYASIRVNGNTLFDGRAMNGELATGDLELRGDLVQRATTSPNSLRPTAGFNVTFIGSGAIDFATPDSSSLGSVDHFGNLTRTLRSDLTVQGIVRYDLNNVTVRSDLLGAGGTRRITARGLDFGGSVTARNVAFRVLDGAALTLNGGPTFADFDPAAIQLDLVRSSGSVLLDFATFTSVPTGSGRYLRATDPSGAGDGAFTVNVQNVTPATHGGFAEAVAPAVINGWSAGVALQTIDLGLDILHPAGLQVARQARLATSLAAGTRFTVRTTDPAKLRLAPDGASPGGDSVQVDAVAGDTAIGFWLQGVEGATADAALVVTAPGFAPDTQLVTMIRPAMSLRLVTPATVPVTGGADPVLQVVVGYNNEGTLVPMGLRAVGPGAAFTVRSQDDEVGRVAFNATSSTIGADQPAATAVTFTLRPQHSETTLPDTALSVPASLVVTRPGMAGIVGFTLAAGPEWIELGQSPLLAVVAPAVSLAPDSLLLAALAGSQSPTTGTVAVTNRTVGTLGGLATEVQYGAGASDWLGVAFDSATAPATMYVTAFPEFLTPGTWTASVIVTSTALGAIPDTLFVSIAVAPANRIVIVSGDGQAVAWGELAPDSLKVRVLQADGTPLGDAFVSFTVSANGGTVSPQDEVTDNDGYVATRWRMGDSLGTHTVTVSRAGFQSAVFTGTSIAGTFVTRVALVAGRTSFTSVGDGERYAASAFNRADSLITSKPLLWESSDLAVVTVDDSGTVTTVGAGSAYIRASVDDGIDSVLVTVTLPLPVGLSIVSGDGQSATVATALAAALVVRYVDAGGTPVSGASVRYQGIYGCCNPFVDSTVTTDASGLARITPVMPSNALPVTVTVSVVGVPAVPTVAFTATPVAGAAVALQFTLNTGGANAGAPIAPGWVVRAIDAFANTATAFTGPITVALSNGPTALATLGGTTTRNAVAGVVTFDDLRVNVANSSWVLLASSPGLTSTASAAFSISIPVTLTIVGNPVLGAGSTATVRAAIPVPSYGTGLVLGLNASNTAIVTVEAPASVTLPGGDTVAFFTITGVGNGSTFLNATVDGVGAGQIPVSITNQIISLPSTLNVPYGLTTSLPVQLAVPAPAGGLTVALVSSDPSRVAVTTPTVFFAAGTTLSSGTLSGVLPGAATISATASGWVTDTTRATTTLALDLIETHVNIDATFGTGATVVIRSGGSLIAAPAGGVAITLTARNATCVAVPAIATVTVGATQVGFPVSYGGTAVTPCATYVVASAPNAVADSMLVNVAVAPFVNAYDATLGMGMQVSTSMNLTSSTFGTASIHIESLDPTLVLVSPNAATVGTAAIDATLIQPSTSVSFYYAALENVTGTARIAVTVPGFRPDTAFVTVRPLGIEFLSAPTSISAFGNNFDLQARIGGLTDAGNQIGWEYPIRAGGTPIVVTLANSNAAAAQLVSTALTGQSITATMPVGSSRIPVGLGAGGIVFDPLTPGATTLTASAPGVAQLTGATWPVTVTSSSLGIGNVTLGAGTHISTGISLSAPQHGGVTVHIVSSDSSRVRLAPNATTVATGTLDVVVPNGSTSFSYYVAAVEGTTGTATLDVTAPGFTSASATATVRALGVEWLSTPGITTSLSANNNLQLRIGGLNAAGTLIETEYPLRFGGTPITVTAANSNAAAAQLVTTALTGQVVTTVVPVGSSRAPVGTFNGGIDFDPLGAGTTLLTLTSPGLTSVPNATASVTVNAPAINVGAGGLGAGTQFQSGATFGASQHGGVTVHVESSDPTRLLLAPSSTAPAVAALDIVMPNGSANVTYFVAAPENVTGAATITVSAPGFITASADVTVRALGIEIFAGVTNTTSLSTSSIMQVRVGGLNDAGTAIAYEYPLRTGGVPITATLQNTNGTVGQLVTTSTSGQSATMVIPIASSRGPSTLGTGGVEFDPLSTGTTTITASAPGLTSLGAPWPVNVSTPTISGGTSTLGSGTQLQSGANLGASAYGNVTVHVESSDPALVVVAPNVSTVGTAAIDIPMTAPGTGFPFVIAALEGVTGTATLTISAPGFTSATYAVTVRALGVEVFSLVPSIGAASSGTDFLARIGGLNAAGNAIETEFPLRTGGTPIVVTFDNSNAAVAQLSTTAGNAQSRTVTVGVGAARSPNGVASGGIRFLPVAAGSTVVTASASGVVRTLNGTQTVTVTP